jgi:YVTN family beta-propeller protein
MLAEELGIDPTPDLQRLEGAILRQDPDLELTPVPAGPTYAEMPEARKASGGRPGVWLVAIGAALALVVVSVVVIVTTGGSDTTPVFPVAPNSAGRIDEATDTLVDAIPTTGTAPTAVVWAYGSLWVANTISRTVARIDPGTNRVRTVPTGGAPTDLAAGEGRVWVLNGLDGTVVAIDPGSNKPSDPIDIHPGARGIAVGAGGVWVTNRLDETLTRIDPASGGVVDTLAVVAAGEVSPETIAVDGDTLWVTDSLNPVVYEIDPGTGQVVQRAGLRAVATDLAVGDDGTLFVTSYDADLVSILDPSNLLGTKTIQVGRGPRGVVAKGSSVWVAESLDGAVSEVDLTSGRVITTPVGGTTDDIAVGGGSVWVSVHA